MVIGLTMERPNDARHSWPLEMAWVRARHRVRSDRPVPLVSDSEDVITGIAVMALKKAGLEWEDVFTCPSFVSLRSAVVAGFGVMTIIRRRAAISGCRFGTTAAAEAP